MGKTKWQESQKLEREWWTKWKNRTDLQEARKELIKRAAELEKIISKHFPSSSRKILQIGPAANGEIHFLTGERYAIDPLAPFFKNNFPELIDPKVNFVNGVGENLPYPSSFFDVILILNVLDHCSRPEKVLKETERCTRKDGVIILELFTYTPLSSFLHSIFRFADKEHPHALTYKFLEDHLKNKYNILEEKCGPIIPPKHNLLKKSILLSLKALDLAIIDCKIIAKKR